MKYFHFFSTVKMASNYTEVGGRFRPIWLLSVLFQKLCCHKTIVLPSWIAPHVGISNNRFSNNRLTWSENLVPVLARKSNNRWQKIVEKSREIAPKEWRNCS